ncbi:2521_t:CDS:2 [Ambispora leptoticha]|uniref:2521_t:CDS:1 n=1 Tax=Ambispora leptoticha TaxID=144679 RepID=A0A9N8Z637_9GLOM|nr:2521_t:CDS:2 [Ambispora leptoticha]
MASTSKQNYTSSASTSPITAPSSSVNNEYHNNTSPAPRQILPMSRRVSPNHQIYHHPQQIPHHQQYQQPLHHQQRNLTPRPRIYTPPVVVPTQFGSPEDYAVSSIVDVGNLSKDNMLMLSPHPMPSPMEYFHQPPSSPGYYQQQHHNNSGQHMHGYSGNYYDQQQQAAAYLMNRYQHVPSSHQQQQQSVMQGRILQSHQPQRLVEPYHQLQQQRQTQSSQQQQSRVEQSAGLDAVAAGFCDNCTNMFVNSGMPIDSFVNQAACNKCKNRFWANSGIDMNRSAQDEQMMHQLIPSTLHTRIPRDIPSQRPLISQELASANIDSSTTVPTQNIAEPLITSSPSSDSVVVNNPPISAIENSADSSSYISLYEQIPITHYEEKKAVLKNSILHDVFFSDDFSKNDQDFMGFLHFDSEASSDTEALTPGRDNSPPLSPTTPNEFLGGEEEFNLFFNDDGDADCVKDSLLNIQTTTVTSMLSSGKSSSMTNSNNKIKESNTSTTFKPSKINMLKLNDAIQNALQSIPSLLAVPEPPVKEQEENIGSITSGNNNSPVIDSILESRVHHQFEGRPLQIRPSYIDINSDIPSIPSPPLKTPELVSDTRRKRKASFSWSDKGVTSDNEEEITTIASGKVNEKLTSNKSRKITDNKKISNNPIKLKMKKSDIDEEDSSNSEKMKTTISKKGTINKTHKKLKITTNLTITSSASTSSNKVSKSKLKNNASNNNSNGNSITKNGTGTQSGINKRRVKKSTSKLTINTAIIQEKPQSKISLPNSPFITESPTSSDSLLTATDSELQQREDDLQMEEVEQELCDPRPTQIPTIFESFTESGVDWCRYCGTTEGVNWRPGPWGKRTLCNKHGCDYKGYGFACKQPRLDLTSFVDEPVEKRDRPVLQLFCTGCHKKESYVGNVLVRCEGCPRAFHQNCHCSRIEDEIVANNEPWYCDHTCQDNLRRRRIVVELPRKRLPLMSTPKASTSTPNESSSTVNAGTSSRPRTSRNSTKN